MRLSDSVKSSKEQLTPAERSGTFQACRTSWGGEARASTQVTSEKVSSTSAMCKSSQQKRPGVQSLLHHPHVVGRPALGFCRQVPSTDLPTQARSEGLNGLKDRMTEILLSSALAVPQAIIPHLYRDQAQHRAKEYFAERHLLRQSRGGEESTSSFAKSFPGSTVLTLQNACLISNLNFSQLPAISSCYAFT